MKMSSSVIECKQVQQIKWWYQKHLLRNDLEMEEGRSEREMKINKREEMGRMKEFKYI